MDHEAYMREALKEAKRAFAKNEVPVGAVIVYNKKIIARAHNQTEMLRDPTAHAEMIAITQAAEYLSREKKNHRGSLEKTSIYVTLEPCPMCIGAMVLAHAENLVYGAPDPKMGACESTCNLAANNRFNHQLNVKKNVLAEESKFLLQEFFRNLRKEKR